MVESIPPKGMTITEYPPIVRTASASRLIDLANGIRTLEKSQAETKKIIDQTFVPDEVFFLAHYGMNPFDEVLKRHFFEVTGARRKLTNADFRKMGQEIMAFKNPAPGNLRIDSVVIMLASCNKYLDTRDKIMGFQKEMLEIGFTSMVKIEGAPIPEQVKTVVNGGRLRAAHVKSHSPNQWKSAFPAIKRELASTFKLKASVTIENHMKKFGFTFDPRVGDFVHKQGYTLSPFLIHHVKSIMDKPDPIGYWSHVSRYRLVGVKVAERLSDVHLVEVNPTTGAPFNRGIVVGVYADEPSNALANVRKVYPHVLELKSDINPKLNNQISISDETSKLKASAERWALTGSKQERKFVNVVRTTWDWPDIELAKNQSWYAAFNSKNSASRSKTRTFRQKQLLQFQSEDQVQANAAVKAGNPPAEMSNLLFGGTPESMVNCFPISISEYYLLPAGTEEALERIIEFNSQNVLPMYFSRVMGGKVGSNTRYKMVVDMEPIRFGTKLAEVQKDMKILQAALCSPYLFTLGYEKLLAGNPMENLGVRASLQCRMRVKSIFDLAKWPRSPGELVFKAPVNDQADIQAMRGKFEAAMRQAGGEAPTELSQYKTPEVKVNYNAHLEGGQKKMTYEFTRGRGYPFSTNASNSSFKLFRYYDSGTRNASWKTLYIYRDLTFISKSRNIQSMFTSEVIPDANVNAFGLPTMVNYGPVAATGTAVLGSGMLLALGYTMFRNRNRSQGNS